mmetsp:Transcript_21806/g.64344  ORF Transcript_21806/g.64344 Transcript_21806/m.64344 type:complete len:230 (-) Transcript_21806:447-1136(-)
MWYSCVRPWRTCSPPCFSRARCSPASASTSAGPWATTSSAFPWQQGSSTPLSCCACHQCSLDSRWQHPLCPSCARPFSSSASKEPRALSARPWMLRRRNYRVHAAVRLRGCHGQQLGRVPSPSGRRGAQPLCPSDGPQSPPTRRLWSWQPSESRLSVAALAGAQNRVSRTRRWRSGPIPLAGWRRTTSDSDAVLTACLHGGLVGRAHLLCLSAFSGGGSTLLLCLRSWL